VAAATVIGLGKCVIYDSLFIDRLLRVSLVCGNDQNAPGGSSQSLKASKE